MDRFIAMPDVERRTLCEETAGRMGLPVVSVEKDFWVCWILATLFTLPDWGESLTFKGGTSLSKCWALIDRFSEDIDIVIDRDFLGLGGAQDPAAAPSKKQLKKRLAGLKATCQERIRESLKPTLEARLRSALPTGMDWALRSASPEEDPDLQTLFFKYPSAFADETGYVVRVVKIEMGARSDAEPAENPTVQPYIAEALPDLLGDCSFPVRAVAPRRTFWEKAMLLHEETYRPPEKTRKARLARHYYDLWCLITKGVAAEAIADTALFARVAEHREVFFRWSWMDYSTLRTGTLRLVPLTGQIPAWRSDYDSMQAGMLFGPIPSFDEILHVVGRFQAGLHETAHGSG